MEDFFEKDIELLFECGYELVDYSNYNFTKGERVFVYIQAGNTIGQNIYGYIEAVAKSSGKYVDFESKKQYYTGYSWSNIIYNVRNNKVIVTKEIIKEEKSQQEVYSVEKKRELDIWYKNLSYGNKKAVDKILGI